MENDKIEMRQSASILNPHFYIERNGEVIVQIYEDACESPAQCQMIAQTIFLKLQNIFIHENR